MHDLHESKPLNWHKFRTKRYPHETDSEVETFQSIYENKVNRSPIRGESPTLRSMLRSNDHLKRVKGANQMQRFILNKYVDRPRTDVKASIHQSMNMIVSPNTASLLNSSRTSSRNLPAVKSSYSPEYKTSRIDVYKSADDIQLKILKELNSNAKK